MIFDCSRMQTEQTFILERADPQLFYGVANGNLAVLKALYPKLRIVARDRTIKVMGDEDAITDFALHFEQLEDACVSHNSLDEAIMLDIIKGNGRATLADDTTIIYNMNGKPIRARGERQQQMVDSFRDRDLTFAVGPAGTGKTYLGVALAVKAWKEKRVKRLILCRPAVEAGEKLGFLPGDMKDKIDPYLQPLYDALQDMLPLSKLRELTEMNVIQIAPLAFMRGRTLNEAIVLLDEAQNCTIPQMKMFLTRMGAGTKMIVTGDTTQIDLPSGVRSGLFHAIEILRGIDSIGIVELTKKDIVRHRLVQKIVETYSINN